MNNLTRLILAHLARKTTKILLLLALIFIPFLGHSYTETNNDSLGDTFRNYQGRYSISGIESSVLLLEDFKRIYKYYQSNANDDSFRLKLFLVFIKGRHSEDFQNHYDVKSVKSMLLQVLGHHPSDVTSIEYQIAELEFRAWYSSHPNQLLIPLFEKYWSNWKDNAYYLESYAYCMRWSYKYANQNRAVEVSRLLVKKSNSLYAAEQSAFLFQNVAVRVRSKSFKDEAINYFRVWGSRGSTHHPGIQTRADEKIKHLENLGKNWK